MAHFTLSPGDRIKRSVNSVGAILQELELIAQDQEAQLAESATLYAYDRERIVSELSMRHLVHPETGECLGWAVWFDSKSPLVELALFERPPEGEKYRECMDCACRQFIRVESIIRDMTLITKAIEWFLARCTPDPSLLWLPTGESIYLAPRSEWKRPECVDD